MVDPHIAPREPTTITANIFRVPVKQRYPAKGIISSLGMGVRTPSISMAKKIPR